MYRKLKIVQVDYMYCNYLRKYDNKVTYNAGTKKLRPYVGVLLVIGDIEYFAPLSSPKEKHIKIKPTIDLIKILDGELGVINLNNMIPVKKNNYVEFDLSEKNRNIENHRKRLMQKQLRWINSNKDELYQKAMLLYNLYRKNKLNTNIKNRCCNFILLEEKCASYNIKVKVK